MKNNGSTFKLLSLFSGCGGMDLGFEGHFPVLNKSINNIESNWDTTNIDEHWSMLPKTNFEIVFANDIISAAKNSWVYYRRHDAIHGNVFHLDSIVDLVKKSYDGLSVFPNNVDIVTGGFPCQDFSVAGKRLGFNSNKNHHGKLKDIDEPSIESRGQLYMWMREVIAITKPKVFVAENVKGLANLNDLKDIIESDFRSISDNGYIVIPARVLHAANFGVPQSRERIIFYGFRKDALTSNALKELSKPNLSDKYDPYPKPTHTNSADLFSSNLMPYVTCRDAFINLQEPNESLDISQQKYSRAKFLKKGQGNREVKLDGIAPTIRAEHHGNIEYRRLSEENGGINLKELREGKIERRLTVRECARLQTFPDQFEFVIEEPDYKVSASSAYKLIGNAVPPLLAYHIAKRLENNWSLYFKK